MSLALLSQAPDTKPGPYYVSCADAGKVHLMAGPYELHAEALADVDKACRIASEADGRAWFMAWGTVRIEGSDKVGRLNTFGLMPARVAA
jgi:hypothetical protein